MTTLEYTLQKQSYNISPYFLFVVDICLRAEELASLKDTLIQTIDGLPKNINVGLITYGSCVQVYELGFPHCTKTHIFKGSNEVAPQELSAMLGMTSKAKSNNFIMPLSQVEDHLISIIEELELDPNPVKNNKRPQRATGIATTVAATLLGDVAVSLGGRILLFMGGPCTLGPGLVVSEELKEGIRSHHELAKESAKYVGPATKV